MTAIKQLIDVIKDPTASLPMEVVEELDRQYPFFTLADAIKLQRDGATLSVEERTRLHNRLALNAGDPKTLFEIIDPAHADWADFYPVENQKPSTPSTVDAIDTFLETYGHSDPASDALLERLIFNPPAPDYLSLLETEEDPALDTLNTPDPLFPDLHLEPAKPEVEQPVETEQQPEPVEQLPPPVPPITHAPADSSLQESLAKMYIRRGRYDKAFEIINTLSLNNPKKSIYFADQLRFLRKLILNQQSKD